jgi:hypothetical protein
MQPGEVEVEPCSPNQLGAVVLAEAVVGAGGTARNAVETLLNAAQDQVAIQGRRVRMQLEYLRKGHVLALLVQARQYCQHAGGATAHTLRVIEPRRPTLARRKPSNDGSDRRPSVLAATERRGPARSTACRRRRGRQRRLSVC